MNLPDLSKVEIPKRAMALFITIGFIVNAKDFRQACVIAGAFLVYTLAQTATDVWGKKITPPANP